jgi:protein subunit release factor B
MIKPEDIIIETYRERNYGGQQVTNAPRPIKITHITTGITVQSESERSQIKNRDKCIEKLGKIVEAFNNYEALQANYNDLSAISQYQERKIENREFVLSYVKTVLANVKPYVEDRALSIEEDIDEAINTINVLLGGE